MTSPGNSSPPTAALATLLSPAGSSPLWTDADFEAILSHQLRSPLAGAGGATFQDALLNPRPDIDHLRQIKEFAKTSRDDSTLGIPAQVCHVLYYAAIAAAEVRTGQSITSLNPDDFSRGLRWALGLPWLPQPFQDLFPQALDRQKS